MNLIYLFGPPASGKSTLMAELTAGCQRSPRGTPFAHDVLVEAATGNLVGIELGKHRSAFPGTDALSLSVSPRAAAFLAGHPSNLVLGEGDRLAHAGFLDSAAEVGYTVTGVYLSVPEKELDRRCAQRGSNQPASWRAGRATKAARLADRTATQHRLIILDSTAAPADNVRVLTESVPALAVLPGRVPS